ncbi:MAG: hypothetical protein HS109_20260 [Burkholderiales bacterium]|nr:hypothetical protein [Burkholderiales bacterium]
MSLETSSDYARLACLSLKLPSMPVMVNPAIANARAVRDERGARIEWSHIFLATLGHFEVLAVTGHEVAHHYLWSKQAAGETIAAELHERLADVVSGWLAARTSIVLGREGLARLARALNLLPAGAYAGSGDRLRDLLHGWSNGTLAAPPLVLVNRP